jgi:hypothetical protein
MKYMFNMFSSFNMFGNTNKKRSVIVGSDNFIIVSSDNFIITGRG